MKLLLLQLLLVGLAAVHAQSCSQYRLVWVSCTGYGSSMDFVGTAVLSSLQSKGLDVVGNYVSYPANTPRDASSLQGANQLASDLSNYANQCPNQRIILGGYSQGVIVLHRASLSLNIVKKVVAVFGFGDPVPGDSFYPVCETNRAVMTCGDADTWCNDTSRGPRDKTGGVQNIHTTGNHQSYASTTDAAVNAVLNLITNPCCGSQCTLPSQPQVTFDQHLNYDG